MLNVWGKFSRALCIISGAILMFMMLIVCVEVFSRYIFSKPIVGIADMVTLLLPFVIFFPIAFTEEIGAHVRIELLTQTFSKRWQLIMDLLAYAFGILFLGILTWQAWEYAVESWRSDQYFPGLLRLPVYPAKFAISFGCFIFTVQLMISGVKTIRGLLKKS